MVSQGQAVDSGGSDDDDNDCALELHFVSGSVSVRVIQMVQLAHRSICFFDFPWLTDPCQGCLGPDMD